VSRYATTDGAVNFRAYTNDSVGTEVRKLPDGYLTDRRVLLTGLRVGILAGDVIDLVKRFVIYGKAFDHNAMIEVCGELHCSIDRLARASADAGKQEPSFVLVNPRLLHAAIGKFGECGEILSAMFDAITTGKLDAVNLGEEFGDDKWYDAIGIDELERITGISLAGWLERNRKKLERRQATKTITDKGGRDLAAERADLEGRN
jgi:hypothetical protein